MSSINLEMAPEMSECREAQELVASQEFQARKTQLADAALVPYEEIRSLKRQVLDLLYQTFCRLHGTPEKPHTARGQEFAQYIAAKGDALIRFGRFNALADHLREGDWRRWPIQYQDPDSPTVIEFVREHSKDVGLFQYGQWLAATQLTQVCQAARLGLSNRK
jgi:4-alpha-glucanotransferase